VLPLAAADPAGVVAEADEAASLLDSDVVGVSGGEGSAASVELSFGVASPRPATELDVHPQAAEVAIGSAGVGDVDRADASSVEGSDAFAFAFAFGFDFGFGCGLGRNGRGLGTCGAGTLAMGT
jgi:hypothetical protein